MSSASAIITTVDASAGAITTPSSEVGLSEGRGDEVAPTNDSLRSMDSVAEPAATQENSEACWSAEAEVAHAGIGIVSEQAQKSVPGTMADTILFRESETDILVNSTEVDVVEPSSSFNLSLLALTDHQDESDSADDELGPDEVTPPIQEANSDQLTDLLTRFSHLRIAAEGIPSEVAVKEAAESELNILLVDLSRESDSDYDSSWCDESSSNGSSDLSELDDVSLEVELEELTREELTVGTEPRREG